MKTLLTILLAAALAAPIQFDKTVHDFGEISTKAGTVSIPAGYTSGGTVSLKSSAISDCVAGNILSGKSILGVSGNLSMPSISQDSTTKVLSIS